MVIKNWDENFVESLVDIDIPYEMVHALQRGILEAGYTTSPYILTEDKNHIVLGVKSLDIQNKFTWKITIEKVQHGI